MTSGGAILFDLDNTHYSGQKIVDMFNSHLTKTTDGKATIKNLIQCVTDIFKYAIQTDIMRFQYVNDFKSPNYGLPIPSFEQAFFGVPNMMMLDLMPPVRRRKKRTSWKSRLNRGLWGGSF